MYQWSSPKWQFATDNITGSRKSEEKKSLTRQQCHFKNTLTLHTGKEKEKKLTQWTNQSPGFGREQSSLQQRFTIKSVIQPVHEVLRSKNYTELTLIHKQSRAKQVWWSDGTDHQENYCLHVVYQKSYFPTGGRDVQAIATCFPLNASHQTFLKQIFAFNINASQNKKLFKFHDWHFYIINFRINPQTMSVAHNNKSFCVCWLSQPIAREVITKKVQYSSELVLQSQLFPMWKLNQMQELNCTASKILMSESIIQKSHFFTAPIRTPQILFHVKSLTADREHITTGGGDWQLGTEPLIPRLLTDSESESWCAL